MTLPDERYRAVVQTRRFLLDLCNSDHTPRVPKLVRETARSMLRHYPTEYDMQRTARMAPDVFAEQMEPLHRMIAAYSQSDVKYSQETVARDSEL
jgi:hypothetical protein